MKQLEEVFLQRRLNSRRLFCWSGHYVFDFASAFVRTHHAASAVFFGSDHYWDVEHFRPSARPSTVEFVALAPQRLDFSYFRHRIKAVRQWPPRSRLVWTDVPSRGPVGAGGRTELTWTV